MPEAAQTTRLMGPKFRDTSRNEQLARLAAAAAALVAAGLAVQIAATSAPDVRKDGDRFHHDAPVPGSNKRFG